MVREYYDVPEFKDLYLEDSYVTDIKESNESIIFSIDFVLKEEHPLYEEPKPDENYCYKEGVIEFKKTSKAIWKSKSISPFTDANGEIDFGNIDEFLISEGKFNLSGEWGSIEIFSDMPEVRIF